MEELQGAGRPLVKVAEMKINGAESEVTTSAQNRETSYRTGDAGTMRKQEMFLEELCVSVETSMLLQVSTLELVHVSEELLDLLCELYVKRKRALSQKFETRRLLETVKVVQTIDVGESQESFRLFFQAICENIKVNEMELDLRLPPPETWTSKNQLGDMESNNTGIMFHLVHGKAVCRSLTKLSLRLQIFDEELAECEDLFQNFVSLTSRNNVKDLFFDLRQGQGNNERSYLPALTYEEDQFTQSGQSQSQRNKIVIEKLVYIGDSFDSSSFLFRALC